MSTIEPVPPPPPVDDVMWWVSPTLRYLLGLVVSGLIIGVNGVLGLLHKQPLPVTTQPVVEVGTALLAGWCALGIVRRRVKHGNDPANPQPAIKMRVI